MEQLEKIYHCPLCSGRDFRPYLQCKDHTVSHEFFQIEECLNCHHRFTNPRPPDADLGRYYESPEYISHSNTHKGLLSKIYQAVRKKTTQDKVRLIESKSRKGSLLDIGCGTGEFLNACKMRGWEALGLEPNAQARNFAKTEYHLQVKEQEALFDLKERRYNVITLWHVLEHVPDLQTYLQQIKKIMTMDGLLLIAVPNCASKDAKLYGKYWAAYDVPRHLHHFTPETIHWLAEKNHFYIEETRPMVFDAYYVSMLSEKYKGTAIPFYFLLGGLKGWYSNLHARLSERNYSSIIYLLRQK